MVNKASVPAVVVQHQRQQTTSSMTFKVCWLDAIWELRVKSDFQLRFVGDSLVTRVTLKHQLLLGQASRAQDL